MWINRMQLLSISVLEIIIKPGRAKKESKKAKVKGFDKNKKACYKQCDWLRWYTSQ